MSGSEYIATIFVPSAAGAAADAPAAVAAPAAPAMNRRSGVAVAVDADGVKVLPMRLS